MSDNVESEWHPRLVKWRPILIKRRVLDAWAAEVETKVCPSCGQIIPKPREPTP